MATITLNHVDKKYPNGYHAIDDITLDINDGEFVILVGPSGCGKSTLLNMIAGLEDISSGELSIDGRVVNELSAKDRDIAMVFQSYALYPHMTVRENIGFPLKLAKLPKAEIAQKVTEVSAFLGLDALLDRKPAQLSGGQRQRVAMGRAIVRRPKVFLMDEPLSNLDAKLRVQMRGEIARLQHELGVTTVYVTHDQTEAMTLGDRVVVLRGGVLQQVGTPEELYRTPENLFVAGFIGSPSMNFMPGTIDASRRHVDTGFGPIALPQHLAEVASQLSTSTVILGIRPEDFEDPAEAPGAGATLRVTVELTESTGADRYVHFPIPGGFQLTDKAAQAARHAGLDQLTSNFVARLSSTSTIEQGQQVDLWYDPDHLYLFDGATGKAVHHTLREQA